MSDDKDHTRTAVQIDSLNVSVRAVRFLGVLLELVLLAAVVYLFDIETRRHFLPVFCVVICGFCVHTWLPTEHQLAGFATLSIGTILFILGLANGLWVVGIGSAMIGICFLPIRPGVRVLFLVIVAAGLVWMRTQRPFVFWPVLGSMFMFRLVIFVYDCRRSVERPSLASALSYFFLLPNVCFPLFPVIDYKSFCETRYNDDEWNIYQRGVTWIVRGLVHLLLYRFIRTYLVPEPYDLYDVQHLAVFMATNYALYLQVSGQFHLITGMLHLFGFNLPRTHFLFFLASSFTDIWRRINIYWKDFMTKCFFFPAFFAMRRCGANAGPAVVVAVFCVFGATWLLHSWQTFWLLGRFPVTANDAFLWLGAGVCVAVNALFDSRHGPERRKATWSTALSLSARTVGMFVLVSLFWACWTKPGFLHSMQGVLNRPNAGHGLFVVLLWMFGAVVIGTVLQVLRQWYVAQASPRQAIGFHDSLKIHLASLGVVIVLSVPWSSSLFSSEVATAVLDFRTDAMASEFEATRLQSYYEDLNTAAIQAGPLVMSLSPQDEQRRAQAQGFSEVSRPAGRYQVVELKPGSRTQLDGSILSVNQFGMRDRTTISLYKPPNTVRIALVGSSIVMGYGVADDEVFSRLFEEQLNSSISGQRSRFEVLNFGVARQWATHRLVRLQRKILGFEPDAIYYIAHQDELLQITNHVAQLIAGDLNLPSAHLAAVATEAGVDSGMVRAAILHRLQNHETRILAAVYQTIVHECKSRGIDAVWIYLPIPGGTGEDPLSQFLPLAENAGFITCDLSDWADSHDVGSLFDVIEEHHPNAAGHRAIADTLIKMIESRPETIPKR